jgi:hypothetical protein
MCSKITSKGGAHKHRGRDRTHVMPNQSIEKQNTQGLSREVLRWKHKTDAMVCNIKIIRAKTRCRIGGIWRHKRRGTLLGGPNNLSPISRRMPVDVLPHIFCATAWSSIMIKRVWGGYDLLGTCICGAHCWCPPAMTTQRTRICSEIPLDRTGTK